MKPSFFFAPFLLFILTTQSIFATAATTDDLVYDVAGKKVQKNVPYYIGSVKGGRVKSTDTSCPVHLVHDSKEASKGELLSFTLNAAAEEYLRLSYPLGITADLSKSNGKCKEKSFLKIEDAKLKPPSNYITNGGLFNTAVSCFQVVKYPKPTIAKVQSYLLQHCPRFCGAGPPGCFNISTYVDNGKNYLATSGTPFEFVFTKS